MHAECGHCKTKPATFQRFDGRRLRRFAAGVFVVAAILVVLLVQSGHGGAEALALMVALPSGGVVLLAGFLGWTLAAYPLRRCTHCGWFGSAPPEGPDDDARGS